MNIFNNNETCSQVFNFAQYCVLEDHRVRLSPLKLEDYDHLVTYAIHEPELWKYSLMQANSSEKLKKYIHDAIASRMSNQTYAFTIFDKRVQKYAGSTRLYDIIMDQATLKIGYTWLGKDFQGTGLNKCCKFLLLDFAFSELKMERVEFRADKNNIKSICAMRSIGCTYEGILRSNSFKSDGTRRDSVVYSILKNEWEQKTKSKLYLQCYNI